MAGPGWCLGGTHGREAGASGARCWGGWQERPGGWWLRPVAGQVSGERGVRPGLSVAAEAGPGVSWGGTRPRAEAEPEPELIACRVATSRPDECRPLSSVALCCPLPAASVPAGPAIYLQVLDRPSEARLGGLRSQDKVESQLRASEGVRAYVNPLPSLALASGSQGTLVGRG